jgi:hypothetical protein
VLSALLVNRYKILLIFFFFFDNENAASFQTKRKSKKQIRTIDGKYNGKVNKDSQQLIDDNNNNALLKSSLTKIKIGAMMIIIDGMIQRI